VAGVQSALRDDPQSVQTRMLAAECFGARAAVVRSTAWPSGSRPRALVLEERAARAEAVAILRALRDEGTLTAPARRLLGLYEGHLAEIDKQLADRSAR
jgi:hypothetical protein